MPLLVLLCLVLAEPAKPDRLSQPWLVEGLYTERSKVRCEEIPGLNAHQRTLCRQQRGARMKLKSAAKMAHDQCMTAFKFNRWNCSLDSVNQLNAMTKETSYVTAIGSAAIVHEISRSCADGTILSCGCGVNREYSTACNDNVKYGVTFARQYLDSSPRPRSHNTQDIIRSAVNVHNNNAGRQMVEQTARTKCSCHGLSGSCTTYTCYKQVASFEEIGRQLYKQYQDAVKVKSVFSPSKTTKLAFIDDSPDYCKKNSTAGVAGTAGRPCLPQSHTTFYHTENCEHLCCDRGFKVEKRSKDVACNCRFQYCCDVICDTCQHDYYEYKCNE